MLISRAAHCKICWQLHLLPAVIHGKAQTSDHCLQANPSKLAWAATPNKLFQKQYANHYHVTVHLVSMGSEPVDNGCL